MSIVSYAIEKYNLFYNKKYHFVYEPSIWISLDMMGSKWINFILLFQRTRIHELIQSYLDILYFEYSISIHV